jgi:two-component system OmpR family response regulator
VLLLRDGHRVEIAHTVKDAMALARQVPFDVFLLDILLPDGNGLELARSLRQEHSHARMIAVTALGMPEDRIAIAEAGFDAHLLKPYRLDQLRSHLAADPARGGWAPSDPALIAAESGQQR